MLNQSLSSSSCAPGYLIATFSLTCQLHHLFYLCKDTPVQLIALSVLFNREVGPTTCHKDGPCHTKDSGPLIYRTAPLECLHEAIHGQGPTRCQPRDPALPVVVWTLGP